MFTLICTHAHTQIYTHTNLYTYTHMHTCRNAKVQLGEPLSSCRSCWSGPDWLKIISLRSPSKQEWKFSKAATLELSGQLVGRSLVLRMSSLQPGGQSAPWAIVLPIPFCKAEGGGALQVLAFPGLLSPELQEQPLSHKKCFHFSGNCRLHPEAPAPLFTPLHPALPAATPVTLRHDTTQSPSLWALCPLSVRLQGLFSLFLASRKSQSVGHPLCSLLGKNPVILGN